MSLRENVKGKGTVTSKTGEKFDVRHDVNVYRTELAAGHTLAPNATIGGMDRYEGVILPVHCFGEMLTLEVQDGRKLNFFFVDQQGTIRATGGFY
jgi:hypothetical protein